MPDQQPDKQTKDVEPAVSAGAEVAPARTYSRKPFKHWTRLLALVALVSFDSYLIISGVRIIAAKHESLTFEILRHQAALYGILLFLNATILPSIALEANKVEVNEEGLTFHNLLTSQSVKWSQIHKVISPIYLKCAILTWKGGFQLINKRDIDGFERLFQTILTKTAGTLK